MVTAAWLTGAEAKPAETPKPVETPKPIVINPAPAGGTWSAPGAPMTAWPATAAPTTAWPAAAASGAGCSNCGAPAACDSCCEEKPGFMDRLKAKFHKSSCDSCCEEKPAKHHHHKSSCETCAPAPTCDTCGGHKMGGLFSKFHKKSCDSCSTCDTGCNSCGSGAPMSAAPIAMPYTGSMPYTGAPIMQKAPEQIKVQPEVKPEVKPDPGKKLPAGGEPGKQVQVIPQPPVLEVAPAKTESPF